MSSKDLDNLFNNFKLTEKGDDAFKSSLNPLVDIMFSTPYLEKNLGKVHIGTSEKEKLFSMFVRDPRYGMGRRDLGRELMKQSGVYGNQVVKAGRYDDLYTIFGERGDFLMYQKAVKGDYLAKKWLPRLTSGSKARARAKAIIKEFGITEKEYRKTIKLDTVETLLNEHRHRVFGKEYYRREEIEFSHLSSLSRIKWSSKLRSIKGYQEYLDNVAAGKAKINFTTGSGYDILNAMNRKDISVQEANILWNTLDKIELSIVPIIDVSGSMFDMNNSIYKAMAVGIQLAEGSTYAPNQFITFSENPELVKLEGSTIHERVGHLEDSEWGYNTNIDKVFRLLKDLKSYPDYLVVLSDMEFDEGGIVSKDNLMSNLKSKGIHTKIIWWNFNSRAMTFPETDSYGNMFMSGYSPELLQLVESRFDAEALLNALLEEYREKIK